MDERFISALRSAEKLKATYKACPYGMPSGAIDVTDLVKDALRIAGNAEQVIYCEECKHLNRNSIDWCMNFDIPAKQHGYCAWAEKETS